MMAVATIGVLLGVLLCGIKIVHDVYFEDRIRALAQFERVRGITDVEVLGYDDITYEVVSARLRIAGRPDAVIVIQCPKGVVGTPKSLRLEQIGPHKFHHFIYGYIGLSEIKTGKPKEGLACQDWIDIGSQGEFGAMLPVKICDVNDLVAHYDELVRYFDTWPDDRSWGRMDDPSGTRRAYCRTTLPGKGPVTPPSRFPGIY
jgi:hypothetical protein